MPRFSRKEVQAAFELWWQVGNVAEDWTRWANMFVPDVTYQDYSSLSGQRARCSGS